MFPPPYSSFPPVKLSTLTQAQLDAWVIQAKTQIPRNRFLPDYIPLLAQANPAWLGVQIQTIDRQIYTSGDINLSFPLMSVVKPFVLLLLLEQLGAEAIFSYVGMEPSEQPFNSLAQLQADGGFPRNPMINSGAIVLASLLPGENARSRTEGLRSWLNQRAGCQLFLNEQLLSSVMSTTNEANQAITNLLRRSGNLATTIDTYNSVCCLSGTVADLAKLGMLLVQRTISSAHCRIVNALMTTCGLYQASGRFAVQVGLPTKSGVSGAMLSIVPSQGAIACYGPALDQTGNSHGGLFLLEQLTKVIDLSIFS